VQETFFYDNNLKGWGPDTDQTPADIRWRPSPKFLTMMVLYRHHPTAVVT